MVKQIALSLTLCFSLVFFIFSFTPDLAIQENSFHTPADTLFMFDIDDVLLKFPRGAISSFILKNSWELIKNIHLLPKIRALKQDGGTGYDYVRLMREEGCDALADAIQQLIESKIPVEGMQERIQKLHHLGFRLDIASNMALEAYIFYAAKYPELFDCFTGIKVIDYVQNKKPIKKPNVVYFQEYIEEFPTEKQRVFFDDKAKNCKAATSCGIKSFVFSSVQQFDKDLMTILEPGKAAKLLF